MRGCVDNVLGGEGGGGRLYERMARGEIRRKDNIFPPVGQPSCVVVCGSDT